MIWYPETCYNGDVPKGYKGNAPNKAKVVKLTTNCPYHMRVSHMSAIGWTENAYTPSHMGYNMLTVPALSRILKTEYDAKRLFIAKFCIKSLYRYKYIDKKISI